MREFTVSSRRLRRSVARAVGKVIKEKRGYLASMHRAGPRLIQLDDATVVFADAILETMERRLVDDVVAALREDASE